MADAANKRPWERIDGETDKAFDAFQVYLRIGPDRSVDAAWHSCNPGARPGRRATGHWYGWSSQHQWVARASAYDDYAADLYRTKHEDINLRIVEKSKRTIEKAITKSYDLLDTAGDLREVSSCLHAIVVSLKQFQPQQAQDSGPRTVEYRDEWMSDDDA